MIPPRAEHPNRQQRAPSLKAEHPRNEHRQERLSGDNDCWQRDRAGPVQINLLGESEFSIFFSFRGRGTATWGRAYTVGLWPTAFASVP